MKFIWKGHYKKPEQLTISDLPPNAVKFKEPETPAKLNLVASLFVIPVVLLLGIAYAVKTSIYHLEGLDGSFNMTGFLLGLLTILPHEFLHGIAFPKKAEVEIWYSIKNMIAFVFSSYPVSKARFIFISLLPNIIFGFIPLVVWVILPPAYANAAEVLFGFAAFCLFVGVGDYLNVYNTLTQMPKGSMTQLSGFHSYWFMPDR